ncbi:MAG: DUF2586 family protein [Chitinophagales bacterium]|nr:DUF2586 family protein [Chitinophagales bacterium]
MLPDVKISLQNGQLGGVLSLADGVCALIVTGESVSTKIQIGEPQLVFSLKDAEQIGLTENDNPFAHHQIKEFYSTAGAGAELYVMIVPNTETQTSMMDINNDNGAKKLLDFAGGRVRLLFSAFNPDELYDLVLTNGIDADVYSAIIKAQELAELYAENQAPIRVILEGRKFNGNAANLTDLKTMTNNRVCVVVGSSSNNGVASVGLFVGRCASNPVQRKASRVKDGNLPIIAGYVGNQLVDSYNGLALMHDKGFVVLRTFSGMSGYFFSDDPTATSSTDDYAFLARGRVIDKAQIIAYLTFIEELHDEIPVNESGRLEAGVVKYLEAKVENQIKQIMLSNREISNVECYINPEQNILSTNKTEVVLRVTPVGYNSAIEVLLGFYNPSNN